MVYDIRTQNNAKETLYRITGIPFDLWESNSNRECYYEYQDYFVAEMIEKHGNCQLPDSYSEFEFVFSHISTSANRCWS